MNDLTGPAIAVAPIIKEVLSALEAAPGQLLTRLSGSGATCFGIFSDEQSANTAAKAIKNAHPEWWVKATALLA
jgi:4-diphosphocytidyl-2-C-methyl-D-erythritol kinase